MAGTIKDPNLRLVPVLANIYAWEKEQLERLGINVSQLFRDFLKERLDKTMEVELSDSTHPHYSSFYHLLRRHIGHL